MLGGSVGDSCCPYLHCWEQDQPLLTVTHRPCESTAKLGAGKSGAQAAALGRKL